jgi:hypothetical protein
MIRRTRYIAAVAAVGGSCLGAFAVSVATASPNIGVDALVPTSQAPPLTSQGTATAEYTVAAVHSSFAPPQNAADDMSADAALNIAWGVRGPDVGPSTSQAILASVRYGDQAAPVDAWIISFGAGCIQPPVRLNPNNGAPSTPPCFEATDNVVINAASGDFVFTFSGDDIPDMTKVLSPTTE